MCVRRGDEIEYKLYRFKYVDGRSCGAFGFLALGIFFFLVVK